MYTVLLTDAWDLAPAVHARLEASGAVTYHQGTKRLAFLRAVDLTAVVGLLATSTDVQTALTRAQVPRGEWGVHVRSLQRLADKGMLVPRPEASGPPRGPGR